MTTAHRPTFVNALGSSNREAPSKQLSAKQLPGHTTLKFRVPGQNTMQEVKQRDLKQELLIKESVSTENRSRGKKRNEIKKEKEKNY